MGRWAPADSHTLTVSGGTAPYAWSVSSGSLPDGISLDSSTGLLSGTPTTAGTSNLTIKVTDAAGQIRHRGDPPDHYFRARPEFCGAAGW